MHKYLLASGQRRTIERSWRTPAAYGCRWESRSMKLANILPAVYGCPLVYFGILAIMWPRQSVRTPASLWPRVGSSAIFQAQLPADRPRGPWVSHTAGMNYPLPSS